MSRIDEAERHGGGQFRVNLLVGIATLKLLIEKNIITADEEIQHVEDTKLHFPEIFDRDDVAMGMKWPIELLQGRAEFLCMARIIDRAVSKATYGVSIVRDKLPNRIHWRPLIIA